MYIDGEKIGELTNTGQLMLNNNNEVRFYDLELTKGGYDDAELLDDLIISSRTPLLCGMMGHMIKDRYEGEQTTNIEYTSATTRIIDYAKQLIGKGYQFYNARELVEWSMGMRTLNKRAAFLITDDYMFENDYLENIRIRRSYEQLGIKHTWALNWEKYPDMNPTVFISAKFAGHDFVTHSRYHDVPVSNKPSLVFYRELEETRQFFDSKGVFEQRMFVYNWANTFTPVEDMLDIFGYVCGVASTYTYSGINTNPYQLGRTDISEASNYQYFK